MLLSGSICLSTCLYHRSNLWDHPTNIRTALFRTLRKNSTNVRKAHFIAASHRPVRPITSQFISTNHRSVYSDQSQTIHQPSGPNTMITMILQAPAVSLTAWASKVIVIPVPASLRFLRCLDGVNGIVLINTVVTRVLLLYIKQPYGIPQTKHVQSAVLTERVLPPLRWVRTAGRTSCSFQACVNGCKSEIGRASCRERV